MNQTRLYARGKKYFYGYQRENYLQQFTYLRGEYVAVDLITPNGLARISSLKQKAEIILGSLVIQGNDGYQLHPFFQFLLKRVIFQQYVHHPKVPEELPKILYPFQEYQEFTQIIEQQQQNAEKNVEYSYYDKQKIEEQKQQFLKDKFISFLNFFKQNLEWLYVTKQYKKIQKLQCLQLGIKRLQSQALQSYFQSQFHKQTPKSQEQIQFLLANINKLTFLKLQQQIIRLNISQRKYKLFYNFTLVRDARQQLDDFNEINQNLLNTKQNFKPYKNIKIKMNKTFYQPQPVIQTIMDMVDMRLKHINYIPESTVLIRDIFIELLKFNKQTTKQFKHQFYYHLDPRNVLFDQLTLKPKLSYRPIVLDLFGVKDKPMSIENRLCFEPSPQRYYNFQSVFQMIDENRLILKDPYYGVKQFYEYNDAERMNIAERKVLQQEDIVLKRLHEYIQVQRYLFLSYYVLNSQELGYKTGTYTTSQRQKYYALQAQQYHNELHKNKSLLSLYLGVKNETFNKKRFNFSNQQIFEYLQLESLNEQKLIQDTHYLKVKKVVNLQNQLMKDIIRYILSQHFFNNVFTIVKYTFIFFLVAGKLFITGQLLADQEERKKGGRKKMRRFLFGNIKNESNYGKIWAYMSTLYERIQSALTDKAKEKFDPIKFMLQDTMAIRYRGYMRQIYSQLHDLKLIQNDLKTYQDSQRFEPESRAYQLIFRKLKSNLKTNCTKIRDLIKQSNFFYFAIQSYCRPFIKKRAQQAQYQNRYYQIVIRKVNIMIHSFASVNKDNLIMYQTMVFPFTCVNKNGKKKIQIPKVFKQIRKQEMDYQFSFIYQIIDYKVIKDPIYFPKPVSYDKQPEKLPPSRYQVYANKKRNKELLAIQPDYIHYHPLYSKKADHSKVIQFAPSFKFKKTFSFIKNLLDINPYSPYVQYNLQDVNMPQIIQEQIRPRHQDEEIIILQDDEQQKSQ